MTLFLCWSWYRRASISLMTFPNPYTICNNKGHTKSNEKRILFELTTDSNFPQFKNINPREDLLQWLKDIGVSSIPISFGSSSHGFSFFKCIWKNQNGPLFLHFSLPSCSSSNSSSTLIIRISRYKLEAKKHNNNKFHSMQLKCHPL